MQAVCIGLSVGPAIANRQGTRPQTEQRDNFRRVSTRDDAFRTIGHSNFARAMEFMASGVAVKQEEPECGIGDHQRL